MLRPDGALNRAGLAEVVFDDAAALADLNAITHPLVRARSDQLLAAVEPGRIGVYEVPLLAEGGPYTADEFDAVVVVVASLPVRLARLAERGLPHEQAMARIAAQATDEQRRALADEVVTNDGTRADLGTRFPGCGRDCSSGHSGNRLPDGYWVEPPRRKSARVVHRRSHRCRRGRSAAGRASPCQGEGRGFESRRPLESSDLERLTASNIPAEWPSGLGKGLQSPVRGFDSRLRLDHAYVHGQRIVEHAVHRAISSVGEHYLDTVGVTGSIPVSPT